MGRMAVQVVAGLFVFVVAGVAAGQAPPAKPPVPGRPAELILSGEDTWRKFYTFFPPGISVKTAEAKGLPTDEKSRREHLTECYVPGFETPPPPAGWTAPDFDDSQWLPSRGRQFVCGDGRAMEYLPADATSAYLRGTDPFVEEVGLVCQRGRFLVKDRAKVRKLLLSVTHRGGFVAYLNGKEVARASLPSGPVELTTAAEDYPLEAFFVKGGEAKATFLNWYTNRTSDEWPLRERSAGPVEIPVSALRDGLNVLALELHRSGYPAECKRKRMNWQDRLGLGFATVGLSLLKLEAQCDGEPAAAIVPSLPRTAGLRVWEVDATSAVQGNSLPADERCGRTIRLVGARNGTFSGQLMVANEKALEGLTVTVSDLKGAKGSIPASAVTARYGAPNPTTDRTRFDLLLDAPPAGAAAVSVWVSVAVSGDAAPGAYTGEATIAVAGAAAVEVPIELHVADWALPDVKDFGSLINIYQSPDTIVRFYKLQRWGEPHWRMIERSLKLMGRAGNIGLFIPLLAESQMGNPESMVVWAKQADGSYQHDFTQFDRYIDTAMKYHTRLRFIAMNIWGEDCRPKARGGLVTVLEAGKKSTMTLPAFGTPECEAMLRPLLTALRQRLAKKGLDKRILLGLPSDGAPDVAAVGMFHNIWPDVAWIRESHFNAAGYVYDAATKATVPVAYNSIVWGGDIPAPTAKRLYGWQYDPRHLVMNFNRAGTWCLTLRGFPPPWSYRMWMESTLACGRNGNGRVGGDFWKVGAQFATTGRVSSEAQGGNSGTLFGLYLPSGVGQTGLGNTTTDLFGAGPDGPVSTVRFENALEGNQEAEARIFLEKALLDKARPLPAELAKRCQDMLDERTNVLRMWMINASHIATYQWRARDRALFEMAAEVSHVLATRPAAPPAAKDEPRK